MRYIGPYHPDFIPTYEVLAGASTDHRVKALLSVSREVNDACTIFNAAIPNVHELQPRISDKQKKAILIDGYNSRSTKMKSLLTNMTGSLKDLFFALCPYCNLESNWQIDHFLPKEIYPEFALYGKNLLPICGRCNGHKGEAVADNEGNRILAMPTNDPELRNRILITDLIIDPEPHFTYRIDHNAQIQKDKLSLVQRHFDRLHLARRYRTRAHSLIAVLKNSAQERQSSNHEAVLMIRNGWNTAMIEEPQNSWKSAAYDAIICKEAEFVNWMIA